MSPMTAMSFHHEEIQSPAHPHASQIIISKVYDTHHTCAANDNIVSWKLHSPGLLERDLEETWVATNDAGTGTPAPWLCDKYDREYFFKCELQKISLTWGSSN